MVDSLMLSGQDATGKANVDVRISDTGGASNRFDRPMLRMKPKTSYEKRLREKEMKLDDEMLAAGKEQLPMQVRTSSS